MLIKPEKVPAEISTIRTLLLERLSCWNVDDGVIGGLGVDAWFLTATFSWVFGWVHTVIHQVRKRDIYIHVKGSQQGWHTNGSQQGGHATKYILSACFDSHQITSKGSYCTIISQALVDMFPCIHMYPDWYARTGESTVNLNVFLLSQCSVSCDKTVQPHYWFAIGKYVLYNSKKQMAANKAGTPPVAVTVCTRIYVM